jgi:DnaJ-class molecular chaperone
LNPFQVLQIDPYASIEEVKRKYRKLSTYVHPDKNPNDKERAEIAFEAVNRAYKMLEDEKERKQCLEVVDEAREQVEKMVISEFFIKKISTQFFLKIFWKLKFIQKKKLNKNKKKSVKKNDKI